MTSGVLQWGFCLVMFFRGGAHGQFFSVVKEISRIFTSPDYNYVWFLCVENMFLVGAF